MDEPKVKKPGRVVIGKSYRLPTPEEITLAEEAGSEVARVFADIPFGVPDEPLPSKEALGFRVPLYGFNRWSKLFTPRQLLALGTFVTHTRSAKGASCEMGYSASWVEAIEAYLTCAFDRMLDFNSTGLSWITSVEAIGHTFVRYALPIVWDFSESAVINHVRGGWWMSLGAILESYDTISRAAASDSTVPVPKVIQRSAVNISETNSIDLIVTDPPYYDAIAYSDLMDYFYVWLRRNLFGVAPVYDNIFARALSPKWDIDANDGELIDDSSRFNGDAKKSKQVYEDGMARTFQSCHDALTPEGRLVIVFAHKMLMPGKHW